MSKISREKLSEYCFKNIPEFESNREERILAMLSEESLEGAKQAHVKFGGGASYNQVVSLFFHNLFSQEQYVQEAIKEFSAEPISEKEIRKSMLDFRGSWTDLFRIEQTQLSLDERIRLGEKMGFFKHKLIQRYFSETE